MPHSYEDESENVESVMTYFMNLSVIHELYSVEGMMTGERQKSGRDLDGSDSGLIDVLYICCLTLWRRNFLLNFSTFCI